ncbi:MAG: hypothetical protein ACAI38_24245 [Myxococcota bacterium]
MTAKAHGDMEAAMGPVQNMRWQLELGVHAWRRGILSPKFGPYLQKRIDGVSLGGLQSAAEEGAFQAIKAYEGALGNPNGVVFRAAVAAIDSIADGRCAQKKQVDFVQQGLNALLKQGPFPDPCGQAPVEEEPAPQPRDGGQFAAEQHFEQQTSESTSRRTHVRGEEVRE